MSKYVRTFEEKVRGICSQVGYEMGDLGPDEATDRIVSLVRELVEGELYPNPGHDAEANASNESINNILSRLEEGK